MTGKRSVVNDLTQGSVSKQLLRFSYPYALANLMLTGYGTLDMIIVGRFAGSGGIAAMSIGGDLTFFITCICMGFAMAGQIMISQCVGAKNMKMVSKIIGNMYSLLLLCAAAVTVISLSLTENLLMWMNTPDEAWNDTYAFCTLCFSGIVFSFGFNAVSATLRGMGDSKHPMMFTAVSAVINVLLCFLFVAGFRWGGFGAGLAVVTGQGAAFIISIVYLFKHKESFHFDFGLNSFRPDRTILLPLLKMGMPLTLRSGVQIMSNLIINSQVNSFGVTYAAVGGVGQKIGGLQSTFTNTLSESATAMDGQNLGAGKPDRVRRVTLISTGWSAVCILIISAALLLFPARIFGIFTSDPGTLELSHTYVIVLSAMFFGFVTGVGPVAVITAAGDAGMSFAISGFEAVIGRAGLGLLLGRAFGLDAFGYWIAMAFSPYMSAIVGWVYYLRGRWETRKLVIDN